MAPGPFSKKDHVVITTLGLEFAVAEILGAYAGYLADKKWGTLPWCLLIGVAVGFAIGFYRVWQEARIAQNNKEK